MNVGDKVIYVSSDDEPLWEWAKSYARNTRRSLSAVVLMALERLRDDVERERSTTRE